MNLAVSLYLACYHLVNVCKCFSLQDGFSGSACQECKNENAYGAKCDKGTLANFLPSAIILYVVKSKTEQN